MGIYHGRRRAGTIGGRRSQACVDFHEAHDGQQTRPIEKMGADAFVEIFALMCAELPRGASDVFWTPHSQAKEIIVVSHVLQCASFTFGHPGATPNLNFVRELFARFTAQGETVDEYEYDRAVRDLAKVDAHSAKMAMSVRENLSDHYCGGVIKKSVRCSYNIMKQMPMNFPETLLSDADFTALITNIGMRGAKRERVEGDDAGAADVAETNK